MRIIYVPIESLEERYSANWNRWLPMEFEKAGIDWIMIDPKPLTTKIEQGRFLDVIATNHYKSLQVAMICEMIYSGKARADDVYLFADIWHFGVEALAYIRDGMNLKMKITGILHAGSYDPHDMLAQKGMGWWAKSIEEGWFRIIDKFFIATEFHKRLLYTTRDIDPNKMVVTGHPTYYEQQPREKENIVVFPHRLDAEKHPEMFDSMVEYLSNNPGLKDFLKCYGWKFIKSKDICKTKRQYYDLLERSNIAVSFADQETWGNAMQEAIFAKCLPVVPNKLSYAEMYHPLFQFNSFNEACDLVHDMITSYYAEENINKETMLKNRADLLTMGENAIPNMIEECRKLV